MLTVRLTPRSHTTDKTNPQLEWCKGSVAPVTPASDGDAKHSAVPVVCFRGHHAAKASLPQGSLQVKAVVLVSPRLCRLQEGGQHGRHVLDVLRPESDDGGATDSQRQVRIAAAG
eukprot:GHRQ01014886.1.p2 GENE.GHRQ01014886.1~~GHRQ01014886.1.p2  ORF type:complete len:115 (-),score=0.59 GHRQ01014886.1:20-364(-)